ncbi:MAG: radical SAM protein [Candidatus Omnitrophota bacterium]|nr:radical SAM protein [Candidatus Omnitrophota bacterium]
MKSTPASNDYVRHSLLPDDSLFQKARNENRILVLTLEMTVRCNNNCSHCYINTQAGDASARQKELTFEQIKAIIDESVKLGVVWLTLTGGEPMLREDFFDIYTYAKKSGLLVSVLTNAAMVTPKHIELFKRYPPRDIEITVYGVTQETYERVTKVPGSYNAFMRGLNLLLDNGIGVRLKATVLHSNIHEMHEISEFCRSKTKDYFRFDPFLFLRQDSDAGKNLEIKSQRLLPDEITELEKNDQPRFLALQKLCSETAKLNSGHEHKERFFRCTIGNGRLYIGHDGTIKLCSLLSHPLCARNIKNSTLENAWKELLSVVRNMRPDKGNSSVKCWECQLLDLCPWCPAIAYFETGALDQPIEYFCKVAHARAEALIKVK